MKKKECFKCGKTKPLVDFYKHKDMADGHLNKCKDCGKSDVRSNRQKNVEYYRDYDRNRGSRQGKEYLSSYRERYPNKYKAHSTVSNAVRDGKLTKNPCEKCGEEPVHGHHDDYLKPLEVRWLCPVCHKAWHLINGEAKNASGDGDF